MYCHMLQNACFTGIVVALDAYGPVIDNGSRQSF